MTLSTAQTTGATAREMADAFDFGATIKDVRPLGRGLINDTYLVTTDSATGRHGVLQRINQRAFPQPELIIANLRVLTDHARTQTANRLQVPGIFSARDGKDYVVDRDGGFWRAIGHIANSVTCETITTPHQAEQAGVALGRFHALVSGLPTSQMHATRPTFHKTPTYFARFSEVAAKSAGKESSAELSWCERFVEARRHIVSVLETARERGELVLRVIHGDPKLDNFLFDTAGHHVISLIDLDTVQPGLLQYDIGDCLRSCANPVGESPKNLDDVRFDLDIGHAILRGYLGEMRGVLHPADVAYFYDAIRLIPFELGLRFLTDHLENDAYFKVDWRGHNLHRAMAQFHLVASIEQAESNIRSLIAQTNC